MGKGYQITKEQKGELEKARKGNRGKKVDQRLRALIMRAEGKTNAEIGKVCEYHPAYVSQLVSKYCKGGIAAIVENHYHGNRRNMSVAEEEELLAEFRKQAEEGQVVEVGEIKAAYVAKVGHSIGSGQIYMVLARHGWRKVMPRSKHPKKASDEVIEASKKLKLR